MSRAAIITRVTKLIALTSSPEPHEAVAAALKACALIREHALVFEGAEREEKTPAQIPRCRQCGAPSANETGVCTRCQRAGVIAIWQVRCESCSHAAAPAPTERIADMHASKMGFAVIDGRVLCRSCARTARTG